MKIAMKSVCIIAIIVMFILSLEVIVGLTSFCIGDVARIRLAAFAAVVAIPFVVAVIYVMINRRTDKPWLSVFMTLGALICDLILVSFANGRI